MIEKINISGIVACHIRTLSGADGKRVLKADLALFFVVPVIAAALAAIFIQPRDSSYLGGIVSVYAIFSALLINAQVALYSIFRSWSFSGSPIAHEGKVTKNEQMRADREERSRRLVREVNTNLSYLILISVLALALCLFFMVFDLADWAEVLITFAILVHFVLTLLMAIKRTYRLFDAEYES